MLAIWLWWCPAKVWWRFGPICWPAQPFSLSQWRYPESNSNSIMPQWGRIHVRTSISCHICHGWPFAYPSWLWAHPGGGTGRTGQRPGQGDTNYPTHGLVPNGPEVLMVLTIGSGMVMTDFCGGTTDMRREVKQGVNCSFELQETGPTWKLIWDKLKSLKRFPYLSQRCHFI